MSIVLSLQGCMAVGKTTAVNYIRNNAPYVNISFEFNYEVIEQIKLRQLEKLKNVCQTEFYFWTPVKMY